MPITSKNLHSTVRDRLGVPRAEKDWFVDTNTGSDGGDGTTWTNAYATMAAAFARVQSGGRIFFRGKVREQLTTPAHVFDVQVIGAGNVARFIDGTPALGSQSTAMWTTPASGATTAPLVKVIQQGWVFDNILFAGPSDHTCVNFFRDAGEGDDEQDGGKAVVRNCRFASGQDGIYLTETSEVLIEDNSFNDLTGYAIKGVAGSGIANPLRCTVRRNLFEGNANHYYVSSNKCRIYDNIFDDGGTPTSTVVLSTMGAGANGANNFVFRNYFQTTTANFNTPDIDGSTTDLWVQNYSFDATSAGVGGNFEAGKPA